MPFFEVHIPSSGQEAVNVTLRVDADNWMSALRTGLQKLGEQGASIQNVLVDIRDDGSLHVTESSSGRVFRIRPLSPEEAAAARPKTLPPNMVLKGSGPKPVAQTQPGLPPHLEAAPATSESPASPSPANEAPRVGPSGTLVAVAQRPPPPASGSHRLAPAQVLELEAPTRPVAGETIGRPRGKAGQARTTQEEVLADVFLRVRGVYEQPTEAAAYAFLLDLALEKIPAEAGSVLRADSASGDLSFVAVRGPKAQAVLASKHVVPAGAGIVGFCTAEGVSLALSDVQNDPRFYPAISEKVDYEVGSTLCAPMMTHGRSFGCIQLLNRKDGSTFTEHELGLLAYIAHQGALYLNERL